MMVLTQERRLQLRKLEERLGVQFSNLQLLNTALTHTSYANESRQSITHNERLEFLGDAVLELASSTFIFQHFAKMPEGEMTKARAAIVCENSLSKLAQKLDVGRYLLLGKGEDMNGGRKRPSILADAFESIIGAIYLDQGWKIAYEYVIHQLHDEFIAVEEGHTWQDYKSILQEIVQEQGNTVHYEQLSESGPAHDRIFEFNVVVNNRVCGTGRGRSKKDAEQQAAYKALQAMNKV